MKNATRAWRVTLDKIMSTGEVVAPRGMTTRECMHHVFACDMADPVVRVPSRKLSYTFMAAEALWILNGDDTVEGIAPYNKHISKFSDDGLRFFGAYGPRVVSQLDGVLKTLLRDRDTRQAVLTTWRPNPPETKDVPCTVALAFSIREDRLGCHAFMRSSDAWLGLPYDCFNFSMIATCLACAYNMRGSGAKAISLGDLHLTAVSSHLYEANFEAAEACAREADAIPAGVGPALNELVLAADWQSIEDSLVACRSNSDAKYSAWRIRP